jgi:hypothetical protein
VDSPGWARLRTWLKNLPGRIDVTPSAELNFTALLDAKVSLKAELRRDPSFVAALREFLEGRLSELVNQANEIVSELVETMRKHWWDPRRWKGLVVIVDSLDHNRAVESEKFQQVRRALVNLFDRDYDNLRFADCRMIFTVPMYVPVTGGKVVRRVTNVKGCQRGAGTRSPAQSGSGAASRRGGRREARAARCRLTALQGTGAGHRASVSSTSLAGVPNHGQPTR